MRKLTILFTMLIAVSCSQPESLFLIDFIDFSNVSGGEAGFQQEVPINVNGTPGTAIFESQAVVLDSLEIKGNNLSFDIILFLNELLDFPDEKEQGLVFQAIGLDDTFELFGFGNLPLIDLPPVQFDSLLIGFGNAQSKASDSLNEVDEDLSENRGVISYEGSSIRLIGTLDTDNDGTQDTDFAIFLPAPAEPIEIQNINVSIKKNDLIEGALHIDFVALTENVNFDPAFIVDGVLLIDETNKEAIQTLQDNLSKAIRFTNVNSLNLPEPDLTQ